MNQTSGPTLATTAIVLGLVALPATLRALDAEQPTFVDDIAPILHGNCTSCHQPGEIGPMALRTYSEVRPWARSIARAVENRDMPPWDADPGYGPFVNDISLSDEEIATILGWVSSGAPRGDGDEAVYEPATRRGDWALGEPDWVYEFAPFDVAADGPDQFALLPIEVDFEEDRWIRAVEVQPGDREVLHHFILWRSATASDLRDGFINAWAAGIGSIEFPVGSARLLEKGQKMIGDFHYHPSGKAATDRTRIGVWFAEPKEVEKELVGIWAMNDSFTIPAGEPNYEARASFSLSEDALVHSLVPHMHYRGKDMTFTAVLPSGNERELLKVSRYDFNWQAAYKFAEPVALPAGTRVNVLAHWDNSADNPHNPDPTVDVTWGTESTDEMLIGFVDYVVAEGVSPKPVNVVVMKLRELAGTHPGQAWRFDVFRRQGQGREPSAVLLPTDGSRGGWFVKFGRLAMPMPIRDVVWDGNRVTGVAGFPGDRSEISGTLQEDGSLLLNMGDMGDGAEITGTPAENEVPATLGND